MKRLFKSTKGDLPVPYIVAIMIAIIVILVLIYWFYIEFNGGQNTGTFITCKANLIAYCTQWATCGYQNCQPTDVNKNPVDFYTLHTECKQFAGQTGATSLPSTINGPSCQTLLGLGSSSGNTPS